MLKWYLLLFLTSLNFSATSQYVIQGKITDTETGDPIPYAAVLIKGTIVGISTDFEGNYKIKSSVIADSINVTYLGYDSFNKKLSQEYNQTINIQLKPSDFEFEGFIFEAGENPAFAIIEKAANFKNSFDKRQLTSYETKNYTKIEIDIDHISEGFSNRKSMQKVTSTLDSIKQLTNDEGDKILPIFFSETLSKYYYRNSPELKKEVVQNTRLSGVGITDGSTISQITGSAFQGYNFNTNWISILEKEFVSPIAEGWRNFYDFDLLDSVIIDNEQHYVLKVYPLRTQDLAFSGTLWINSQNYALQQLDLTISKDANLNFIERIKIQQELKATPSGPMIPIKTRVQIKIGQITPKSAGLLAKFYTSVDSLYVGAPKPSSFFTQNVVLSNNFKKGDDLFWKNNRADPLSIEEIEVLKMVDTLKNIPIIKRYTEGLKFIGSGYLPIGKIDFGPWPGFFNINDIEGVRMGMGVKTNIKFSNKWLLQGYLAYGFKDQNIKYRGSVTRIIDRNRWTTASLSVQREIDQVGLEMENLQENNVFLAASRFGTLRSPYLINNQKLSLQRAFFKGFLVSAELRTNQYDTISNGYDLQSTFNTSEVKLGVRYGKDEIIIIDNNRRISFGPSKWPIVALTYAKGFHWALGDFRYDKLNFYLYQKINLSLLGVSRYELDAGKIFGAVPYALLKNHLGNEMIFYTSAAFNTMNFNEFTSNQYLSLRYRHFFEGFVLNKIPLIKQLKWRLVANANLLYGNLKEQNLIEHDPTIHDDDYLANLNPFHPNIPYIELGYGVENVFKFFRVDFFHRMNYLDLPAAKPFHVQISAQIIL